MPWWSIWENLHFNLAWTAPSVPLKQTTSGKPENTWRKFWCLWRAPYITEYTSSKRERIESGMDVMPTVCLLVGIRYFLLLRNWCKDPPTPTIVLGLGSLKPLCFVSPCIKPRGGSHCKKWRAGLSYCLMLTPLPHFLEIPHHGGFALHKSLQIPLVPNNRYPSSLRGTSPCKKWWRTLLEREISCS
jgi:hypothetical protein